MTSAVLFKWTKYQVSIKPAPRGGDGVSTVCCCLLLFVVVVFVCCCLLLLLVGCFASQQHGSVLRDGSAQTIVRAAMLT